MAQINVLIVGDVIRAGEPSNLILQLQHQCLTLAQLWLQLQFDNTFINIGQ